MADLNAFLSSFASHQPLKKKSGVQTNLPLSFYESQRIENNCIIEKYWNQ